MKKTIALLLFFSILWCCEKDDICEEGAAITPQLIITFYDYTNPTEKKDVEDFIFDSGRYFEWNIDSEALGRCYDDYQELRVGHLGDTYKDKEFRDDSYMWSGDSINKYNDKFK